MYDSILMNACAAQESSPLKREVIREKPEIQSVEKVVEVGPRNSSRVCNRESLPFASPNARVASQSVAFQVRGGHTML